jgi:hypothetical protein
MLVVPIQYMQKVDGANQFAILIASKLTSVQN